ncbi:MAG: hypothetical protein JO047_11390 [Alphaproteobacteria bacterium]|nr:hypothetical protein [Alphaproteobacteria bacterium]
MRLADGFGMVGVLDIDWLLDPRFTRLLDTIAASPGAVTAVRFFGALNAGVPEKVFPAERGGGVWLRRDGPIDWSTTLSALDALVSRDLIPFVGLNFFPPAVSESAITPPAKLDDWQRLVRAFLDTISSRFGQDAIARWWFEVWNEPNMPPFWRGSFEQYLALYRATSAAVTDSGHRIRLGGPAVAYVPDQGRPLIERFLQFLREEPQVQCDFVSLHRKGIWVAAETEPVLARPIDAAIATAEAALRIVPERCRGLSIVNNEADMKVAFDRPYEPRMTEQFPSWLVGVLAACQALNAKYAAHGIRFVAAADDANQQLIQGPFDGRRSLMTPVSDSLLDLVKLPVFGFYELLRLLGSGDATVELTPERGLYRVTTRAPTHIAAVFTHYHSEPPQDAGPLLLDVVLEDVPWTTVNIAEFRIDAEHGNSYAAWRMSSDADRRHAARMHQELGVAAPIATGVRVAERTIRHNLQLPRFATSLLWITPSSAARPPTPGWIEARTEGASVLLRWSPNREPDFYGYEVHRISGEVRSAIAPIPLRGAIWLDDTAAFDRPLAYEVRAISASGIGGPWARSNPVQRS